MSLAASVDKLAGKKRPRQDEQPWADRLTALLDSGGSGEIRLLESVTDEQVVAVLQSAVEVSRQPMAAERENMRQKCIRFPLPAQLHAACVYFMSVIV